MIILTHPSKFPTLPHPPTNLPLLLPVFQTIGGALFVSTAEAVFANEFISSLRSHVPSLNPYEAVAVGASELRSVYHGAELDGVVASYMDGIKVAFALSTALAGVATLVSVTVPWVSVKGKAEMSMG